MTGPDAIIIWIVLGCIAVVTILGALIVVAASLADGAEGDPSGEEADAYGAVEGGQSFHNGNGI